MQTEINKIKFFKENIINRIEELRPFMSDVKYRLYMSMIKDCQSLDDIREMAELDMQFNMFKYIKEIDDKLKMHNTTIDELEAVTNQNIKVAKLSIITPKKKQPKTNIEIANDIDLSTLGEDLEDEEVLASAANLLMMRLNNMPAEELYDYDNDYEEVSEEDVDDINIEDDYYEEDIDDEDDDDMFEDIDETELGLYETEDTYDESEEELDIEEDNEDDDIIDFGLPSDNEGEDEEETDWDALGEDLFVDDESEDEEDNEEDTDWDSLGDDLFVDDDLDDEDEEDEETDWDTLGDDLFVDDESEDEEDEDIETEDDFDSLGDDLFDDSIEDETDEEDNEDTEDEDYSIDNIDANDLFGDSDDEEEDNDNSDDDDMFDIDESDFDFEEPDADEDSDEFDDFFSRNSASNATKSNKIVHRETTPDKIFINGTKRGNQTQQMFNMIGMLFDKTEKIVKKTGNEAKGKVHKGIDYINNSDYFKLDN